MGEVSSILEKFCGASRQKVTNTKTVIYFSRKVLPECQRSIANFGGFKITSNIGRYLGIPIIHGWFRSSYLQGIINKVYMRLNKWSTTSLSLAGRETLVQSVLQAIPTYSMHIFCFPVAVCNKLDQLCRHFL